MDDSATTSATAAAATQTRTPPRLEDLARRTARTLLLPYIIDYATTHGPSDVPQEVSIIVNSRTGSLTMIDGGLEGTQFSTGKEGYVPASKESIDALPTVKLTDRGSECAICLSEFEVGEEAKQMPCKHKYHAGCIDKWLGIQGSCPSCRYKMPTEEDGGDAAEEQEEEEEDGGEEEEEEEGGEEGEEEGGGEAAVEYNRMPTFVFHIYFAGRNRVPGMNPVPSIAVVEDEGYQSAEDMEVDSDLENDVEMVDADENL